MSHVSHARFERFRDSSLAWWKLIFDKLQSREKEQFKTYAYWSKTAVTTTCFTITLTSAFARFKSSCERYRRPNASRTRSFPPLARRKVCRRTIRPNPSLGTERRRENKEKKPYNDKFNHVNQELFYESPPRKQVMRVSNLVYMCSISFLFQH